MPQHSRHPNGRMPRSGTAAPRRRGVTNRPESCVRAAPQRCSPWVQKMFQNGAGPCAPGPAIRNQRDHDERRQSGDHAERSLRRLSAYAAAQARRNQITSHRIRIFRHQAGESILQADGARAQIRCQRDGDRDLCAGQSLRQAARSPPGDHDGTVPAGNHPLQRGASAHAPPVSPANGSASAPTARPPRCGCAASFRTTTAWISIGYGGSRSKMVMWPSITSRRALNGPPSDKNLLTMLREGELDAAIYGADLPNDPTLQSVIAIRRGRRRPGTRSTRSSRSITWWW